MNARTKEMHAGILRFDEVEVDFPARKISFNGKTRSIEPKIITVLQVLIGKKGQVVTRKELIQSVWASDFSGDESLTRAISLLRRALGQVGGGKAYIETISKSGYRFVDVPMSEEAVVPDNESSRENEVPASASTENKSAFPFVEGKTLRILTGVLIVSTAFLVGFWTMPQHAEDAADSENSLGDTPVFQRDIDRRVIRSSLDILIKYNRPIDRAVEALVETATLQDALLALQNAYKENDTSLSVRESVNVLHQIGALAFDQKQEVSLAAYKELVAINPDDWLASWQLARIHNLRQEKAEAKKRISDAITNANIDRESHLLMKITEARISAPPYDQAAGALYDIADQAKAQSFGLVWSRAIPLAINYDWLAIATSPEPDYQPLFSKLDSLEDVVRYQFDQGIDDEAVLTLTILGVIERAIGKYSDAEHSFLRALDVELVIRRPTRLHHLFSNLANTYYSKTEFEQAEIYNEKAIEIAREAGLIADLPFNWQLSARIAQKTGREKETCQQLQKASLAFDPELKMQDRLRAIRQNLGC